MKSPGVLKALEKAEKEYSRKKAAKASKTNSKQLLKVLIPQQVEMQVQALKMAGQIKGIPCS